MCNNNYTSDTYAVYRALEEVEVREGALDVLVDLEQELLVLKVRVPRARLLRVQWLTKRSVRAEALQLNTSHTNQLWIGGRWPRAKKGRRTWSS